MAVIQRANVIDEAGAGAEISARVQLTNAQMLALNGTPITLVAAPGAGRAIDVESVDIFFDVTTTAYTLGTGDTKIEYASGADIIDVAQAGLFDQATDQHRTLRPAAAVTPVVNSAVRIINEVANFTGGNAANTVSIDVRYRIIPAAAFS